MIIIDKSQNLEKHNIWVKLIRIFLVPMLNSIPAPSLQKFIIKFSPFGRSVIQKAGTAHSLEEMYVKKSFSPKKWHPYFLADFFWNTIISQPKAIRNRLKIVQVNLNEELSRLITDKKHVDMLNLGGGSSRAIIQTAANYDGFDIVIRITNIDRDLKAIELGRNLAHEYGLADAFTWINNDVRNIKDLVPDNTFDVVEMVGLLDYFDNSESIKLIGDIFNKIKKDGLFIVGNVIPNSEVQFVENVGWPKMYYKTTDEMYDILEKAGFNKKSVKIILDPLKVHMVAMARK